MTRYSQMDGETTVIADAKNIADIGTIAYLTSQYPAPSHTFIRREIAELRTMAMTIKTYSIRAPVSGLESDLDTQAQRETFYVLDQGIALYAATHAKALFSRPVAYLRLLKKGLKHRAPGIRALIWSAFHFAESIVLAAQMKRDGIVHLHNHFANPAANVGMLAAEFAQIPWSLTLHGISETDYPAGLLLADKIAAARFVACVSWFGRAQAMRISSPGHWHKFHIVRCGIDLDLLPVSGGDEQSKQHMRKQLVCVARLSSEKGHLGLLRAIEGLGKRGIEVDLVLVGDGPEEARIKHETEVLKLTDRVQFAGRKPERETLDIIARSDLLVLPSFMEGLPVVLMEAMALGVPVVASRVAGIPELVEHGRTGLLYHPADWQGLEQTLADMLSDTENMAKMAQAGKAVIAQEYDIKHAGRILPALFADAILSHMPTGKGQRA